MFSVDGGLTDTKRSFYDFLFEEFIGNRLCGLNIVKRGNGCSYQICILIKCSVCKYLTIVASFVAICEL